MDFETWWDGQTRIVANKELARIVWNAGAEDMRERAAMEAQYYSLPSPTARSIMKAIRNLPVGESSRAPEGSTKS